MPRLQLVSRDDDAIFLKQLKMGDVSARGAWFDEEARRVRGLVLRLIGPRAEVGELVHDVFVQAFQSVTTFEGNRSGLRAWLTGVTVRVVRMQLKKWRVRRIMRLWSESEDEAELVPSSNADPDAQLAVSRTWAVLSRFPTEERLAFALRYFNEFELTEVAAALDVSLATAKRRLSVAHARFLEVARADPVLSNWAERLS